MILPRDQVVKSPLFAGIGAALEPYDASKPEFDSLLKTLGGLISQLEGEEAFSAERGAKEVLADRPGAAFPYMLLDHGFRQLRRDLWRFEERYGSRVRAAGLQAFADSLDDAEIRMKRLRKGNSPKQPEAEAGE